MAQPIHRLASAPSSTVQPNALSQTFANQIQDGFIPVETREIEPKPWTDVFYSTKNRRPFLINVDPLVTDVSSLVEEEIKLKVILYKTNTQGYESERFVYIPDTDSSFVTTVNRNSYIRVQDVINRLGPSCQEVYKKDKEMHKKNPPKLPFCAWKQDGSLIPVQNDMRDYYRGLLYGVGDKYAPDDRMFQKWFNVAVAATYPQTEPWTIISRFWDNNMFSLDLYFVMGSELSQSPQGTQKLKESVKKVRASAQKRKDSAEQQNNAKDRTLPPVPVPFVPVKCEVIEPPTDEAWFNGKLMIGRHPLDLYKVWTPSNGLISLLSTYKFGNLQALSNDDSISRGNWDLETMTTVTPLKINGTRTLKRDPDQTVVMGTSSNNVANRYWQHNPLFPINDAEWLHRSAWSYGGLGIDQPASSSQDQQNLFLGTKATNTNMIRWEEFIKRYVLKTGQSAVVRTTTQDPQGVLGDRKPCWLAPFLFYEFTLNHSNPERVKKSKITFAALERVVPLRFEFEVGRLIDEWYFNWNTEDLTDGYDKYDNPPAE